MGSTMYWWWPFAEKYLNIYLVRHGETEGNVDRTLYKVKADHAIRLTPKGVQQADDAGRFLMRHLKERQQQEGRSFGRIRVWHSSYYRARETAGHILQQLAERFDPFSGVLTYHDEPFLIEQKAGLFDGMTDKEFKTTYPEAAQDYEKHIRFNGRTYAQSPMGDSRLDVTKSVKHHFGSIARDFEKHNIRNVIVVCHGVTERAFLMGWMRYCSEWFDAEKNPGNCWIRQIHGNSKTGYTDKGYIFGDGAPLHDPMATQRQLENAEEIFMLMPQRTNAIVPRGVKVFDPFAKWRPK